MIYNIIFHFVNNIIMILSAVIYIMIANVYLSHSIILYLCFSVIK